MQMSSSIRTLGLLRERKDATARARPWGCRTRGLARKRRQADLSAAFATPPSQLGRQGGRLAGLTWNS